MDGGVRADPKRVLLIRIGFLGDLILVEPTIRELIRLGMEVALVASDHPALAILKHEHPALHIRSFRFFKSSSAYRSWLSLPYLLELFQFIRRLRREKFDLVVNLTRPHYPYLTLLLTLLMVGSEGKTLIGIDERSQLKCLDRAHPVENDHRHWVLLFSQLLASVGLPIESVWPDLRKVRSVHSKPPIQHEPFRLVLHPGASGRRPRWPEMSFIRLIRKLLDGGRYHVIGVSTLSDWKPLLDTGLLFFSRGKLELRLDMPVEKLPEVIASSQLFIGQSSGPFHIAAALQIPSIVLRGPSDARYDRYPQDRVKAMLFEIDCLHPQGDECPFYLTCSHVSCLRRLSADDVFSVIESYRLHGSFI